jgi:hypothetical protein
VKIRVEVKTDALASLYTGLTTVASGDTAREIARECAGEATALVQQSFARSTDPYGKKWPRPIAGNKPGTRSGALRSSSEAVPLGARVQLWAGVPYARFFFRGTVKMTARAAFPDARGLPPAWKRAFDLAARRVIARRLGKGR